MYDSIKLSKELRQHEYEAATTLYRQLIAEGYPGIKAVAMVYRAGSVEAQGEARRWRNEYHKLKHNPPLAEQLEAPVVQNDESEVMINE